MKNFNFFLATFWVASAITDYHEKNYWWCAIGLAVSFLLCDLVINGESTKK